MDNGEFRADADLIAYYSSDKRWKENIINITSARTLKLIYPGGALSDTAQNLIYTPYPVFQWLTNPCRASLRPQPAVCECIWKACSV